MSDAITRDWRIPVFALLVATFAVCTTELIISGILPALAQRPCGRYPDRGAAHHRLCGERRDRRPAAGAAHRCACRGALLLLAVLGIFVVGNIVCALSVSYWMLLATRLILAASQGLFFGVVMVLAMRLAPEGRQGAAPSRWS